MICLWIRNFTIHNTIDIYKYSSPGNHNFKSHYRRHSCWFICCVVTGLRCAVSPLVTLWGFGLWVCWSDVWFIRLMPWEWTSLRHPSCNSSSNLLYNLLVNTLANSLCFFTLLESNREPHLNLVQWHQQVCEVTDRAGKQVLLIVETGTCMSWENTGASDVDVRYRLHSDPFWPGRDAWKCW